MKIPIMTHVYTDGSRTPQRSGWGVVAIRGNIYHCISGDEKGATNNKMETTAFLEGLKAMQKKSGEFYMYSDSQYVLKTLFEPMNIGKDEGEFYVNRPGWIKNWENDNSRQNIAIFREILRLLKKRKPAKVFWVRGHNLTEGNEIADRLSTGHSPLDAVLGK